MLVVVIHPEQWNGGSDRCTLGLLRHFVQAGHQVVWLTTMIDDYWAGEEFQGVDIREIRLPLHPGDWFSQNIALSYHLILKTSLQPDLVVVDHSASCVPLLKWYYPKCRVLFYCHFPQQLVTPSRFIVYRVYSWLMGIIEGRLFEYTDAIMVNSEFTSRQFQAVMPTVPRNLLRVVYPPCDVDSLSVASKPISRKQRPPNGRYLFLSMNRFWPQKRLDIILDAAEELKRRGLFPHIQMAGSVMPHIPESRIYFELLKKRCKQLRLDDIIEFVPDPSDERKFQLYRQCDSAIYTPPNEHFGIVPIEALEQRRPVIVIDSGGPAETVIEGVTGTKIADTDGRLLAEAMAEHMGREEWAELDLDEHYAVQRARFEKHFSWAGFGQRIDEAIAELFAKKDENEEDQLEGEKAKANKMNGNGATVNGHRHEKNGHANGNGHGHVVHHHHHPSAIGTAAQQHMLLLHNNYANANGPNNNNGNGNGTLIRHHPPPPPNGHRELGPMASAPPAASIRNGTFGSPLMTSGNGNAGEMPKNKAAFKQQQKDRKHA